MPVAIESPLYQEIAEATRPDGPRAAPRHGPSSFAADRSRAIGTTGGANRETACRGRSGRCAFAAPGQSRPAGRALPWTRRRAGIDGRRIGSPDRNGRRNRPRPRDRASRRGGPGASAWSCPHCQGPSGSPPVEGVDPSTVATGRVNTLRTSLWRVRSSVCARHAGIQTTRMVPARCPNASRKPCLSGKVNGWVLTSCRSAADFRAQDHRENLPAIRSIRMTRPAASRFRSSRLLRKRNG
jgi:hypothetical protein